jgi:hypothetical protein
MLRNRVEYRRSERYIVVEKFLYGVETAPRIRGVLAFEYGKKAELVSSVHSVEGFVAGSVVLRHKPALIIDFT